MYSLMKNVTGGTIPAEDEMTIDERRKYLRRVRERYWAADRAGRGELLTEMEAVTGLHRKSLIRLAPAPTLERECQRRVRSRTYAPGVEDAISIVWECSYSVRVERLIPVLAPTAQHPLQVTLSHTDAVFAFASRHPMGRLWSSRRVGHLR